MDCVLLNEGLKRFNKNIMNYDVIVIGAGIVGLASALKIKEHKPGLKVLILEKENKIAAHQTGNNSGVIHSGIYYKPGSLKATNCRKGYNMLLNFCKKENIHFELCGKLIVAVTKDEIPRLENLYQRGIENGLTDIKKISAEEIKNHEPYTKGVAAIHVPYTGIIDYKVVCEKYLNVFENRFEGEILLNQKVSNVIENEKETVVVTNSGKYKAKIVVNCGGLYSDKIAKYTVPNLDVKIIPFRGEYYTLSKEKSGMVKNLIYPVPDPAFPFLGVHFTRRVDGKVEAGPNAVFAFKREGYKKTSFKFSEAWESLTWRGFQKVMWKHLGMGFGEYYRSFNKIAFTHALQKLIPSLTTSDIVKGGAGVRAQACTQAGSLVDDFLIFEKPGVINVCNAPSPAATASLAIGEEIANITLKHIK